MEGSLLEAVRSSDSQEVARLLSAGVSPNVPDELGETPIFEATAVDHVEIVALLLLARADPQHQSLQGMVARQMALEATASLLDLFSGKTTETEEAVARLPRPLQLEVAKHFAKPSEQADHAEPVQQPEPKEFEATQEHAQYDFAEEPRTTGAEEGRSLRRHEISETSEPKRQDPAADEPKEPRSSEVDEANERRHNLEADKPARSAAEATRHQHDAEPKMNAQNQDRASEHKDLKEQRDFVADSSEGGAGAAPGSGCIHVVLHSPLVALRREPCMRSTVLRHARPGDRVALADWDATGQWRRVAGEDGWMPVKHPSLGWLVKAEAEDHFVRGSWSSMSSLCEDVEPKKITVQEAWRQLYEGGILNIPPPNGSNAPSIAGQALAEAAMTGRAQTAEGEKALASLDIPTLEYVMASALQHLR
ncbi:unnamed protein product [Durusdinium trenchii]|uniref:Uncharacterized protein n=1 Tax=Durusdinium trenchii TaxID=1381693 RepID=A0ABP0PFZ0_9DINO